MSDFNYDIEETTLYTFNSASLYGESVQDGEPTPESPVPIEVVEPGVQSEIYKTGYSINASGVESTNSSFNIFEANVKEYTSAKVIFTINHNSGVITRFHAYKADGTWIEQIASQSTNASGTYSQDLTLPSLTAEIRISTRNTTVIDSITPNAILFKYGDVQTPIDLNANVLASLPDGTKDTLNIDNVGNVSIVKNVGYTTQALTDGITGTVGVDVLSSTGEIADDADVYYKLANPLEISLDSIDVSSLFEVSQVIPITFVTTLDPESAYSYTSKTTYEVLNPYEDYDAPEMEIPPVHPLMQEWETFDPNNWDLQTELEYTYENEWHAVYTVYLGELMQSGVFNWERPELNWQEAAYDEEQYKRVCDYFNLRFKWREISIIPILKWFDYLRNKLVYELMPKYKPLYERVAEGINPLADSNEYYKNRTIQSAYPETLLSENADYITDGKDEEFQRIKEQATAEAITNFAEFYKGVDELLLDELEVMFISLYTTNINGL